MSLNYIVGEGFKRAVSDGKPIYRFSIDGTVELPNLTVIGSPRVNEDSYDISKVRVVANEAGTADYTFVIKSYDVNGGDEITHVNDETSLTSKTIEDLIIDVSSVGANRSLELSVQSATTGTFSKDITITIL